MRMEAFGDEGFVLLAVEGLGFQGKVGEMGPKEAKGLPQVGDADFSGSLARNEKDMLETLTAKGSGLGEDFSGSEGFAGNIVGEAETAVVADVLALVGEVEGGEEAHGVAEALPGKLVTKAGHRLQVRNGGGRDEGTEVLDSAVSATP